MPLSEDNDDMGLSKQTPKSEVVVNQLNAKIIQLVPQPPYATILVTNLEQTLNNNNISGNINLRKKANPPHCPKCNHTKHGHGRSNTSNAVLCVLKGYVQK